MPAKQPKATKGLMPHTHHNKIRMVKLLRKAMDITAKQAASVHKLPSVKLYYDREAGNVGVLDTCFFEISKWMFGIRDERCLFDKLFYYNSTEEKYSDDEILAALQYFIIDKTPNIFPHPFGCPDKKLAGGGGKLKVLYGFTVLKAA